MAKEKFSDEVKTFIVQASACFDSPSEVAEAVKKEFGLDITKQYVESLDPTKAAGKKTAKVWKAIFERTREEFLGNTATIAIAHRAYRLRILQRMVVAAEKMKNFALVAQLLEQAAKEVGDSFTNKRQISGPDGKPIKADLTMTLDEKSAELARRWLG